MGKKKDDKRDYISSLPMENSEMRERVISIGKRISEELEQGNHPDTLSRWMAHYIAQLISEAENNIGVKKKKVEKECFETILKLWEYKSYFPDGKKPFERFDIIFDTLEKLNPDNRNMFFYRNQLEDEEPTDDLVKKSMKAAQIIDEAARVWLECIFKDAIELATDDKIKEWLKIALPIKRRDEVNIYFKVLNSDDNDNLESRIKNQINHLEKRIEQLNGFKEYSERIRTSFTNQITKLKNMLAKIDNE
jgi:DNA-binding transcriptional regulator/RsmH inhibitor MraZ